MRIFARKPANPMTPSTIPPSADPAAERLLESAAMEAISRGSHQAFAGLVDRTAKNLAAGLEARLEEPRQRTAILAATYVEVWWLAGCRSDTDADVAQWIGRILERRIADSCRVPTDQAHHEPGRSRAEHELADLLGRPIDDLWPV
jgi:DNA-directed RNA polymerase specialized sigma24 family protein